MAGVAGWLNVVAKKVVKGLTAAASVKKTPDVYLTKKKPRCENSRAFFDCSVYPAVTPGWMSKVQYVPGYLVLSVERKA